MKRLLFSVVFLFSLNSFGAPYTDQEITDTLKSYLGLGTYVGGAGNNKCIVIVTKDEFPPQIMVLSKYKLEIFSKEKYGWYAFSTNSIIGGRGDCADIKYDTGTYLKVKNSGKYAPCFSVPTKSNPKGLEIIELDTGKLEISTLNENGQKELSCKITP